MACCPRGWDLWCVHWKWWHRPAAGRRREAGRVCRWGPAAHLGMGRLLQGLCEGPQGRKEEWEA